MDEQFAKTLAKSIVERILAKGSVNENMNTANDNDAQASMNGNGNTNVGVKAGAKNDVKAANNNNSSVSANVNDGASGNTNMSNNADAGVVDNNAEIAKAVAIAAAVADAIKPVIEAQRENTVNKTATTNNTANVNQNDQSVNELIKTLGDNEDIIITKTPKGIVMKRDNKNGNTVNSGDDDVAVIETDEELAKSFASLSKDRRTAILDEYIGATVRGNLSVN